MLQIAFIDYWDWESKSICICWTVCIFTVLFMHVSFRAFQSTFFQQPQFFSVFCIDCLEIFVPPGVVLFSIHSYRLKKILEEKKRWIFETNNYMLIKTQQIISKAKVNKNKSSKQTTRNLNYTWSSYLNRESTNKTIDMLQFFLFFEVTRHTTGKSQTFQLWQSLCMAQFHELIITPPNIKEIYIKNVRTCCLDNFSSI